MHKVVKIRDGKMFSTFKDDIEYIMDKQYHQEACSGHEGGYYFFSTIEDAHRYKRTLGIGNYKIVECKVWGKFVLYDFDNKFAYSYFKILRFSNIPLVLLLQENNINIPKNSIIDDSWYVEHLNKYQNGKLPEQSIEFILDGKRIGNLVSTKRPGTVKKFMEIIKR